MALDCTNNVKSGHVIRVSPVDYASGIHGNEHRKEATSSGLLLHEFMGYTSSHGFGHINRVENRVGKGIWAALTLIGVAVAIYQVYNVIHKYAQFEYNTLMDIRFQSNISFPMITLCNLNPFRLSEIVKMVETDPVLMNNYQNFMRRQHTEDDFDAIEDLLQSVFTLDPDTKSMIGHQLEDILVDCNYGPHGCGLSNFTKSFNMEYGNCYSFNHNAYHVTNRAGPRYGLSLLLFTEVDEYIAYLAGSTGFKVIIHDHNQVPFPSEQGFHISAGFKTQIGIRRFEMRRLGDPYYTCHPSDTAGDLNYYHREYPNSYSRSVCIRSCYQADVTSSCGCYVDDVPVPDNHDNSIKACSMVPSTEECADELYTQYFADNTRNVDSLCPNCHPVCTEVKYYGAYSQSMFPVPQEQFVEEYIESLTFKNPSFNAWFESLEARNLSREILNEKARYALAAVDVFFDELNYEYVYQKAASTTTDVISNLGGQLGLWIGMSLLSLFEYFELIGRLIAYCVRRLGSVEKPPQRADTHIVG